jgi:hypothetical protein
LAFIQASRNLAFASSSEHVIVLVLAFPDGRDADARLRISELCMLTLGAFHEALESVRLHAATLHQPSRQAVHIALMLPQ